MSKPAAREVHSDTEPLFTGTHKGANNSLTLNDPGKCFRSLGADPELSLYIENATQGTNGTVTLSTDDTVGTDPTLPLTLPAVLGITWDNGDTYNIYKTSTKNSHISDTWVDRSRGWKINKGDKIDAYGWRAEDADIDDRGRTKVFGPGQGR
jgi:hypothetical protein